MLSKPPEASAQGETDELIQDWCTKTLQKTQKILGHIQRQARVLSEILKDVQQVQEMEQKPKNPDSMVGSPDDITEHAAAVMHRGGDQPDSESSNPDTLTPETRQLGLATFFCRRADYRACQELLDRVGESQDAYEKKGMHERGSVASNLVTAMRKAHNQTTKLGVHRTSLMPNEFELVRKMTLFRGGLDSADVIWDVSRRLKPLLFSSAQCIIRSGTIGMGMYFINNGTCDVSVSGNQVAKLAHGDYFGEVALTMASQRTADVQAQGLVEVFEFTRNDLKTVAAKYPPLLKRLKDQGKARVTRACTSRVKVVEAEDGEVTVKAKEAPNRSGSLIDLYEHEITDSGTVDPQCLVKLGCLFRLGAGSEAKELTEQTWAEVVRRMKRHRCLDGEKIVGQGLIGNSLYVIETGTCAVKVNEVEVGTMISGDFFGEVALILSNERTADIISQGESCLLRLTRDDLCAVLDEHPALFQNLRQIALKRVKQTGKAHDDRTSNKQGPLEPLASRVDEPQEDEDAPLIPGTGFSME